MEDVLDRNVDLVAEEASAVFATALRRGGRLADLFAEDTAVEQLTLSLRRGKRLEDGGARRQSGVGIRVLDDTGSWYAPVASIEGVTATTLRQAASDVGERVESSARSPTVRVGPVAACDELPADVPTAASADEKRALLEQAADAALSLRPELSELRVDFQGRVRRVVVASSDGRLAATSRSVVGLRVDVRYEGRRAHAVGGGAGGLGLFLRSTPESIAGEAIRLLRARADAETSARRLQGETSIVLAGGWGGVWLHEIVGHLLEADLAAGRFAPERIGRRVACELVTVTDDARLAGGRASAVVDDEGTPARTTTLIEAGILTALLTDRATARRMNLPESGSGRRQDYRFEPLPRTSNLLLAAGDADPESLLEEAGAGLYVTMIGNGIVRPADDAFAFDVLEGYEIENGRVAHPVQRLRVSGRPSEMLNCVRGIASDFRYDPGRGLCAKSGQVVPVSVGMPTILIGKMTVEPLS